MGKNYGSWKRLATALLHKLLARTNSISSSSPTSSSFSQLSLCSTSQLNNLDQSPLHQGTSILPMKHSDLTLDHKDWKAMLPPGRREVVWRSSSMSFFLDRLTGKNCFLLGVGAMNLMISGCFDSCWEIIDHPKSRFSKAAELIESQRLYIEGNLKTKMLSTDTCYAAYLVFGFAERYARLNSAVSIIRTFYNKSGHDYPDEQAKTVRFQEGYDDREDGWMEIQVGKFYVGFEENGKVQVELFNRSVHMKSGLIVEGIEFRPFNSIT